MAKNKEKIESEVKAALSAIKDRKRLDILDARLPQSAQMLNLHNDFRKRLEPLFAESGVNIEQLKGVLAEYQRERLQVLKKQHAESAKDFAALSETLRNGLENRRRALEHLASKAYVTTPIPLLTANLIFATPIGMLVDSLATPGNNWAKIKFITDQQTDRKSVPIYLNFYFYWRNESQYLAVINANTDLVLQGWCSVEAETMFFGGSSTSLDLSADLRVFVGGRQLWGDSNQHTHIDYLSAYGGWDLFSDAGRASKDFWETHHLSYSNLLVPSYDLVVFEVSLTGVYYIDKGTVMLKFLDAERGSLPPYDGYIICPALNIELLTAPSVTSPTAGTISSATARRKTRAGRR
jgi:hypothetical protein